MNKERVVCAAVMFEREHIKTGTESNINVLCVNYDDENIEEARFRFENNPYYFVSREIEGFITNKNRFVDALEARRIASDAGQVPMLVLTSNPPQVKPLSPKDLY